LKDHNLFLLLLLAADNKDDIHTLQNKMVLHGRIIRPAVPAPLNVVDKQLYERTFWLLSSLFFRIL
jgi:hypothetical protein